MALTSDDFTQQGGAEGAERLLGIDQMGEVSAIPIPSLPPQSAKAQPERKLTQSENTVSYLNAEAKKNNPPKKFESGLP